MKINITILLFAILLPVILISCESKDGPDPIFRQYYLEIRFEDKSGNDKIEGIGRLSDGSKVKYDLYKLTVEEMTSAQDNLNLSPLRVRTTDAYESLVLEYSINASSNLNLDKLTYKLKCPYIFGDEEEHIIVSNWEKKTSTSNYCTSIVVDGKTYTTTETDEVGIPVFLVQVDS